MRSRLSALTATLAAGLAVLALVGAGPAPAEPTRPDPSRTAPSPRVLHPTTSSGGGGGTRVLPLPTFLRLATTSTDPVGWQVAPGVTYRKWVQTNARGPMRVHLLTVKWQTPGISVDYAKKGSVRSTAPVPDILRVDRAVAGVNGDFYDIGHTGAPLGLGRDRETGLVHGRTSGWNASFYFDSHGVPQVGQLPMEASVTGHPELKVTNVNSPFVYPDGIGVYTGSWGRTDGYAVTRGQRDGVRMVAVRDGRVVATKRKLPTGTAINGLLLIGRGQGASRLGHLRKGQRIAATWHLQDHPQMAISGNHVLIGDGVDVALDDRTKAPRTAIGIDRDTHELLIVAVDGRKRSSPGATMVELADLMQQLGADEALNLDGGGSTTMVARRTDGTTGVVNRPSDGFLRWVSNALEVTYRAPAGS
ncbi:MAG: phosphodiester glycosidase family protein [Nocardioides sp.]